MENIKNMSTKKKIGLSIAVIIGFIILMIIISTMIEYAMEILVISGSIFALILPIILIVFGIGVYLLPIFIAIRRKHSNLAPIVLLTIFLGWIGIGWIIAIIWAFTDNTKK